MSSVRSGPFDQKNTTYIVTGASLVNDLVTYTQSLSAALVQTGQFAAHPNAALVTQGYLLVDTGKRLVPGQQPNVPTLLIGVNAIPMDTSGRRLGSFPGTTAATISGFIDPNSPNVAIYSRDRPTTFNDNLYFSGATNLNNAGNLMTNASLLGSSGATDFTVSTNGAGVRHRGPGVFSGGALTAAGGANISTAALAGGALTATVTAASAANGVVTYTAANTFAVGEVVSITGLSTAAFNLTNVVITNVSSTLFRVSNPATGTAVSGASGVATVVESGVLVPTSLTGTTASGAVLTSGTFTSASYTTATGVLLFTVPNTFNAGQTVTISGVTGGGAAAFNLTNAIIASATSSNFTVNTAIGQGSQAATDSTGTATVTIPALTVTSGGLRVNAGSTRTTATITGGSYTTATGVYSYTVANSFTPGQVVTVVDVVNTAVASGPTDLLNITGVVATASSTAFTINGTAGSPSTNIAWASGGTATATQNSLVVNSSSTTVNGPISLGASLPVVSPTTSGGSINLANGNIWTITTTTSATPSFTVTNAPLGCIFYVLITQASAATTSITFTQSGATFGSSQIIPIGTTLLTVVRLT